MGIFEVDPSRKGQRQGPRPPWLAACLAYVRDRFVRTVSVRPAVVGGVPGYEVVVEPDVAVLGPGIHVRVEGHAVAEQGVAQP